MTTTKNPNKIIDLRSDTVTKPSQEMRQAMFEAECGDDVYGEDPTVNKLEKKMAKLTNKEDALFVTSGTMGNLISLLVHCQPGQEAIVGSQSHISLHEQSGASALGGIRLKTLENQSDGKLDLNDIEQAINPNNIHFSESKLICLENTWSGNPLELDYMHRVKEIAIKHNLKMHLDGARLFNASLALDEPIDKLAKPFDSISLCFSKGLGCPVGSIICGDKDFIYKARRKRKVLGGGMRQAGILASACLYALDNMVGRLLSDHGCAAKLAQGLEKISGIDVIKTKLRTNMVFFKVVLPGITTDSFIDKLAKNNLLVLSEHNNLIRAVTHYGIESHDIDKAIEIIHRVINSITLLKV